MEEGRKE
jgi:hypothetical protein